VSSPSFPNSASAEMSVSFSLLLLEMELNYIQHEVKGGQVIEFTQIREGRDACELLIVITRNGVECYTDKGTGW
jgi:hypothetical protein